MKSSVSENTKNLSLNADAGHLRNYLTDKLLGTYQGAQHHSYLVSLEDEKVVLKVGHNPSVNQ